MQPVDPAFADAPDPDASGPEADLPTAPETLLARLAELGIPSVTHRHPPMFTVEQSKALRGELPGGHCKNLLLKDRKAALWLVVALEDQPLDLKRLHLRLGSARLTFASAERLWQVLGVRPGSVTPFGLINDSQRQVNVVLDQAMMAHDLLNYHPLTNDRTTALRPAGLLRFIAACGHRPRILDLSGPEPASDLH